MSVAEAVAEKPSVPFLSTVFDRRKRPFETGHFQTFLSVPLADVRDDCLGRLIKNRIPVHPQQLPVLKEAIEFFSDYRSKLIEWYAFAGTDRDQNWSERSERELLLQAAEALQLAIGYAGDPSEDDSNFQIMSRIVCGRLRKDPSIYWAVPGIHSFLERHAIHLEDSTWFREENWQLFQRLITTVVLAEDVSMLPVLKKLAKALQKKSPKPSKGHLFTRNEGLLLKAQTFAREREESMIWAFRLAEIERAIDILESAKEIYGSDLGRFIKPFHARVVHGEPKNTEKVSLQFEVVVPEGWAHPEPIKVKMTTNVGWWQLERSAYRLVFQDEALSTEKEQAFTFMQWEDHAFTFVPHRGLNRFQVHIELSDRLGTYHGYVNIP